MTSATVAADGDRAPNLPLVVTSLIKGVVYRDEHAKVWSHLQKVQPQLRDYFEVIGLVAVIDEAEGYAFLRQRVESESDPDAVAIPRLMPRQPYSQSMSMLLVLLRKRLAEFDAGDAGTSRLILTGEQMVDMVRTFMPATSNEVLLENKIMADVQRAAQADFLRKLPDQADTYEVRRILKAFITADRLADLLQRMRELAGHTPSQGPADAAVNPATDGGVG